MTNLLGVLGLSQYEEKFVNEQISGPLLMELDDEMLRNDLGMKKKLDRIKLRLIIEGNRRVKDLLVIKQ